MDHYTQINNQRTTIPLYSDIGNDMMQLGKICISIYKTSIQMQAKTTILSLS